MLEATQSELLDQKAYRAFTYTKTDIDLLIGTKAPLTALNNKQDKLPFPASEGATGWGVISDDNIVRRLIGD